MAHLTQKRGDARRLASGKLAGDPVNKADQQHQQTPLGSSPLVSSWGVPPARPHLLALSEQTSWHPRLGTVVGLVEQHDPLSPGGEKLDAFDDQAVLG